jgi:hypothetical protein
MVKFYISVFIAVVFGSLFFTSRANAEGGQSITIGPSIINLALKPGTTTSSSLSVINGGSEGYSYTLYASPYGVNSQNYQPSFKSLPGFANISSWFKLSSSSGYLNPGQSLSLDYSISVPANTAPGSYYAAIFAESGKQVPKSAKTQVAISQRVGSLVYINVSGNALERGSISSWGINFFQTPQVKANLKLSNSGKLYYVSNINVYFRDILGGVKYHFISQKIVIPKVVRSIPVVWPDAPAIGLFKANGTVTIYGQKRLVSHYFLVLSTTAKIVIGLILLVIILSFSIFNSLVAVRKSIRKKIK